MDSLLLFKIISVFSIFVVAFIGGIIPLRLAHYFKDPKTMSYANCLSAGILLGASLIHLLFDAEEEVFAYPFAHLCCGVGFFTAFMMEKVIFSHKHEHGIEGQSAHGENLPPIITEPDEHEVELQSLTRTTEAEERHPEHHELGEGEEGGEHDRIRINPDSNSNQQQDNLSISEADDSSDLNTGMLSKKQKKKGGSSKHGHGHGHDEEEEHGHGSHRVGFILFSVLSLESFISGSALGIANSPMSALGLGIAIITHIWAEAFALCASFMKSKMEPKRLYRWITFFSFMTPVGIFFGMALKSILAGSQVALVISSLLISFAAGTFLYVAIVEIITEEFENPTNKWTKLNLLLIGYAFMSALAKFV